MRSGDAVLELTDHYIGAGHGVRRYHIVGVGAGCAAHGVVVVLTFALDEIDPMLAQPIRGLREGRAGDVEGEVLDAADLARSGPARILAFLVGEDSQQPTVPRIEVEVILVGLAQVGLLEDERHAQKTFPEVDRALPRRSHDRGVVSALNLDFLHLHPARNGPEYVGKRSPSLSRAASAAVSRSSQ